MFAAPGARSPACKCVTPPRRDSWTDSHSGNPSAEPCDRPAASRARLLRLSRHTKPLAPDASHLLVHRRRRDHRSSRASAVHVRSAAGSAAACARQRSSVSARTPSSPKSFPPGYSRRSILATARRLNSFPHLATCCPPSPRRVPLLGGDNYPDTRGLVPQRTKLRYPSLDRPSVLLF